MPKITRKTLENARRLRYELTRNPIATDSELALQLGKSTSTISRLICRIRQDPESFGFDPSYLIYRDSLLNERITVNLAGAIQPRALTGYHFPTVRKGIEKSTKRTILRFKTHVMFLQLVLRGESFHPSQRQFIEGFSQYLTRLYQDMEDRLVGEIARYERDRMTRNT
jgi:hypothetical protein